VKFRVMFRASWTRWRWIAWQGEFQTSYAAQVAIFQRNIYDRSADRIVVESVFDGRAWQEVSA
jgi:hypothetical protein